MRKAGPIFTVAARSLAIGSPVLLAFGFAAPAAAQEDYRAIVTIMRACSQIADTSARAMCYDNNIRPSVASAEATAGLPPASAAPVSSAHAAAAVPSANGFGSEMIAAPHTVKAARDNEQVQATVAAVARIQPGIFLLTLADSAQWRFVDSAPDSYAVPRAGDEIELDRGSLGSVFLSYDGQRRLRVMRVR